MKEKLQKVMHFFTSFTNRIFQWFKRQRCVQKFNDWIKGIFPEICWLYTLFFKRYILRDENFLSNIVRHEIKPYKKELKTKKHFGEVLSKNYFIFIAGILPFVLAGLCLLISMIPFVNKVIPDTNSDEVNNLITALHSTAAVVAGFTGILVALIAFGINANTFYVGGDGNLFQMIIKRGYYLSIAAFSVGVVVLSLAAGAFGPMKLDSEELLVMTFISVFLGAATLCMEIRLLGYTLRSIDKKACRDLLLANFKDGHRKSLLAEIRRRIGFNILNERLNEMGFELNIFQDEPRKGETQYKLRIPGFYLNDIHLSSLKAISEKWQLKKIDESEDNTFDRVMNRDEITTPKIPVLLYSNENKTALVGRIEEDQGSIQKLVNRSFICNKKPKLVMPESNWDELGRMLKTQVRDSNDSGLEDLLKIVEEIITDYLSSLNKMGITHARQDLFSFVCTNYKSPELHNLGFRELIVIISESSDKNCVESVFKFLSMIARAAFDEKSLEYYSDTLSWIGALYDHCISKQVLAKLAQDELVDSYNFLGPLTFQAFFHENDKSLDSYEKITPFVEQYLNRLSSVSLRAARNGDSEAFKKLFDIISSLPMNEHSDPRIDYECAKRSIDYTPDDANLQNKYTVSTARLNIHCLINLTRTVIAAWLAELCKVNKFDRQLASDLVQIAMEPINESTDIFEVYLQASGDVHRSSLGYDWWDHVDRLSGKGYSIHGSTFDRWIKPFWIAYSLQLAGSNKLRARKSAKIRLLRGFRGHNYQTLEGLVDKVIADEKYYDWFAKKEDLEKGKECILKIFNEIKEHQEQMDIDKLLSSPLSPPKLAAFEKDCIEGYQGKNEILNLCLEFGISRNIEVAKWSDNVFRKHIQKKEYFIEDWHNGVVGQQVFGQGVAKRENYIFSKFIEDNLVLQGKIANVDTISSNLKAVAAEMRSSGLNPNIVLIPEDHKFQSIFTSKPDWQRESIFRKENFPRWVSTFDGMEVFVWSCPTRTSIAVIDVKKFIAFNAQNNLNVKLKNTTEEDFKSILDKEKDKPDPEKTWHKELEIYGSIENLSKAYLWSELTATAQLGLINEKASIPSYLKLWIQSFESDSCVFTGELPIHRFLIFIPSFIPRLRLRLQRIQVGYPLP